MKYVLNPFALVAETDESFIFCTADRLQVRLPKHNKPFVDRLVRREELNQADVERYVSQRCLQELVAKRLLLEKDAPPLEGRYSRQLGYFSLTASDWQQHQGQIAAAHVLILGAGALGSHVAWNLAAIGAGKLTVVDFDTVEETNLNRQLMYTPEDFGKLKVDVLCAKLREFNPQIELQAVNMKICSKDDIESLMDGVTLVIKAIDTPEESTGWANEVCVRRGVPYITGGFLDYVAVVGPIYIPGQSICFACLDSAAVKRLHGTGPTFAPLVTIVSSMISMCVYRIMVGATAQLVNKLMAFDSLAGEWQTTEIAGRIDCTICGHAASSAALPQDKASARPWGYHASILALMTAAAAIMAVAHDRFTGVLMFLILFASLPALDLAVGGNPDRFRREAFLVASLYCVANIIFVGLMQLPHVSFAFSFSLPHLFDFVRQACGVVIEIAIAISVLFFLAVGYMAALKKIPDLLALRRNS